MVSSLPGGWRLAAGDSRLALATGGWRYQKVMPMSQLRTVRLLTASMEVGQDRAIDHRDAVRPCLGHHAQRLRRERFVSLPQSPVGESGPRRTKQPRERLTVGTAAGQERGAIERYRDEQATVRLHVRRRLAELRAAR